MIGTNSSAIVQRSPTTSCSRKLASVFIERSVGDFDRVGRAAVESVLQIVVQIFRNFRHAAIVVAVVNDFGKTFVVVVVNIRCSRAASAASDAGFLIHPGVFGHL